jgi:hypothetical protein
MTGQRIDPLHRKKPERKFFMPLNFYDPIFGVPGITERPSTVAGKVFIPVEMRDHPRNILFGGVASHKNPNHWINHPGFWEHYRALKMQAFDWNYDPNMQLDAEHFRHRQAVRIRDNSNGATLYSIDNQRTPKRLDKDDFYTGYGEARRGSNSSVF